MKTTPKTMLTLSSLTLALALAAACATTSGSGRGDAEHHTARQDTHHERAAR